MRKFYEIVGKTVMVMGLSFVVMFLSSLLFKGAGQLFDIILANTVAFVQFMSIGVFAVSFILAVVLLYKSEKRQRAKHIAGKRTSIRS